MAWLVDSTFVVECSLVDLYHLKLKFPICSHWQITSTHGPLFFLSQSKRGFVMRSFEPSVSNAPFFDNCDVLR